MLHWLGLIISGCTAGNVYNVLPDDSICERDSCLYLSYLIDNHQYYFTSNTTIMFSAEFHHTFNNLVIQNVSNFSLVSTSEGVITCSPQTFIGFYNVVNLTIKNLSFSECGNSRDNYYQSYQPYCASIFFHECTNVQISNVYIDHPIGYGIMAINMLGYNTLERITVFIGRLKPFNRFQEFSCSYGIHFKFADSKSYNTDKVFVTVSNITLLLMPPHKRNCTCASFYYEKYHGIFVVLLKQHYFAAMISIKNSIFSSLIGNILMIDVGPLANSVISLNNCIFKDIRMHGIPLKTGQLFLQYVLSIYYTVHCDHCLIRSDTLVSFEDCDFKNITNNEYHDEHKNAIIFVEAAAINCSQANGSAMFIKFRNILFYDNLFTLINVTSTAQSLFNEPLISILVDDKFLVTGNMGKQLICLNTVQVYFNGVTKFITNIFSTIIYSDSSKLIFTNTVVFHRNEECNYLISLNRKWLFILLVEQVNVTISFNKLRNEIISVSKVYNYPFPYCIFQLSSNFYQNFSINLFNNTENLVNSNRSNSTINKLTSHCKMNYEIKLYDVEDPLTIYKQITKHKQKYQHHYPLGIHINICYCPSFEDYDCSVDQLGKVYPGQTLTVDLCLPYNDEKYGIVYVETFNDNLPPTACKIYSQTESKNIFNWQQGKKVNFTIKSNCPTRCELFLTAQPDLYTYYDAFYIQLLPCPLGFMLQNDVCNCDTILGPYIEWCSINYQTVKRLTGCWISGNTLNNSTKYYVANNCPIFYCSQVATMINVQDPDTQCQQHRTGSLCSQCIRGYSLVLGSSKCKRCTNAHLAFSVLILLNGLLVILIVLCLNLTVTRGTPNALILYVNVIQINNSSLHLQSRLINILSAYVTIVNLGSYFEMCIYDGMNVYAKKWIQLVFPTYLILVAFLFIVASRYSNKLFWLTHNRSLPVLATLFVLTYTYVLQTISSVFLLTTITSLPNNDYRVVWILDPSIKLYEWKFLLLLIVCLILLLLLLILNAILLFTKTLMRFSIIYRLKPFIDALQGPFKNQHYYWIGVHLLIRNAMLLISILEKHLSITIGCIMLLTGAVVQSYLQPYKNKSNNYQEMLLFYNYIALSVLLLFDGSESVNVIVLNVMVGLSFLQFLLVIAYHIHLFVIMHQCARVQQTIRKAWIKFKATCWHNKQNSQSNHIAARLQIPEVSFNFSEFREPLLALD